MRRNPARGVRAAGALLGFVVVTAVTFVPASHTVDLGATRWLQRAAPTADWPAFAVSYLGNAEVLVPGFAVAGAVLALRRRRQGLALLGLAVGLAAVSVIAVVFKHLIVHPGPPESLARHLPVPLGAPIQSTPFSLPSGHTMRATFVAGTLLRRFPFAAAALVLGMMAALVYLGEHWLTDVLAAFFLSWACVEAARAVTSARSRNCRRD
ncbi:MAG TPA: phosphatase PAP2 family protein [bacterium]|nr:phosphatase PAP2 family protein [bacterium]